MEYMLYSCEDLLSKSQTYEQKWAKIILFPVIIRVCDGTKLKTWKQMFLILYYSDLTIKL